ncbi:hypothetical protein L7F22_005543 [Adiantum nelumboides]|nr:hypothetical protein [Adiantum nelumboides]
MAESNANMTTNNAPEGTVSATLSLGTQYESLDVLRSMVREQAIKSHVELRPVKLIDPGTPLYARQRDLGNKEAIAEWVALRYVEKLREHPMYRPKELMDDLRRELGVSISNKVAWKAKQHALGIIHGDHAKSYGKLQSYCNKLVASNPGTVAHVPKPLKVAFVACFLHLEHASLASPIVVGWMAHS